MADERVGGSIRSPHVTQHLLKLSGGDVVTADRKILPAWTGVIPVRIVIITNVVPSVPDSSGALASRFMVLSFKHSFLGREDIALGAKLAAELPGILNWALEGWRRLQQRGHFVQPDSQVRPLTRTCCRNCRARWMLSSKNGASSAAPLQGADEMLYEAFIQYRRDNNQNDREHPDMRTFGRDLASAARKVVKIYSGPKKARFHAYTGRQAQPGAGAEEIAATRCAVVCGVPPSTPCSPPPMCRPAAATIAILTSFPIFE